MSDEQRWLEESVEALLAREAEPWRALVKFGALSADLGAVELCLIGRAIGAHLASVPFLGSAALRYAVAPLPEVLAGLGDDAVALALVDAPIGKAGVEHAATADVLAVVAAESVALVDANAPGVMIEEQPSFDPTVPLSRVAFDAVALDAAPVADGPVARDVIARLESIGALLAAAEAVGAAGRLLHDACAYAGERRQFGRPIGSFQALRHLLADMYVRQASSWSSVLYAAAALDEDLRAASIAKAYVSRATREVAHGAIQVFGGIAITAEHPAHRYLRRIVVRGQQFGDAAHHERALGRALAAR